MTRKGVIIAGLLALPFVASAILCAWPTVRWTKHKKLTEENWSRVASGMTLDEVIALIGVPDEVTDVSQTEFAADTNITFQAKWDDGSRVALVYLDHQKRVVSQRLQGASLIVTDPLQRFFDWVGSWF